MRSGLVLVVRNDFVATCFRGLASAVFRNHKDNVQICTLCCRSNRTVWLPKRSKKTTRPCLPNVETFLLLHMELFDDLFQPLDAGSSAKSKEEQGEQYPKQYPVM